ncbi:MAG: NADH-quinone oxidoreductase subunit NuoB [Candidatus Aegiribacteria sp.]
MYRNDPPEPPAERETVWRKIDEMARANSLWVTAYGTGCGAIELRPLHTSRFDMERFGISMRPTPRQADVLIISGYLSVKTLKRVIRVYEQMQTPRYIVALGSCTINGGMYYDSYNTLNVLDRYIPVDVYVNGCMPRPEAIIDGFSLLMSRIKEGKATGWRDYLENLEEYRKNQKRIIGNWDLPDYNW